MLFPEVVFTNIFLLLIQTYSIVHCRHGVFKFCNHSLFEVRKYLGVFLSVSVRFFFFFNFFPALWGLLYK